MKTLIFNFTSYKALVRQFRLDKTFGEQTICPNSRLEHDWKAEFKRSNAPIYHKQRFGTSNVHNRRCSWSICTQNELSWGIGSALSPVEGVVKFAFTKLKL